MPIRKVEVSIKHSFEMDIPDELLDDGNADLLDSFVAEAFIDEPYWYFNELVIFDLEGKVL